MKISIALFIITYLIVSLPVFAQEQIEYYPVDIPLKTLLKQPNPDAEEAFIFPIDVKITGVSKDEKWYKVYIHYDLLFLGRYTYEGWIKVDLFNRIKGVSLEAESFK